MLRLRAQCSARGSKACDVVVRSQAIGGAIDTVGGAVWHSSRSHIVLVRCEDEGYSVVWEEEGFLGGCTVSRCMMISDCKAKISSMSEKCCANALLSSKIRT